MKPPRKPAIALPAEPARQASPCTLALIRSLVDSGHLFIVVRNGRALAVLTETGRKRVLPTWH